MDAPVEKIEISPGMTERRVVRHVASGERFGRVRESETKQGESMRYDEFIERVRERGEFGSTEEAEAATGATLSTLGEYLTDREGPDLAERLPEGVSEHLLRQPPERSEIFSAEDFWQLVGERENTGVVEARHHVWAVMGVVEEAVGRDTFADVVERQFPSEFASILSAQDW